MFSRDTYPSYAAFSLTQEFIDIVLGSAINFGKKRVQVSLHISMLKVSLTMKHKRNEKTRKQFTSRKSRLLTRLCFGGFLADPLFLTELPLIEKNEVGVKDCLYIMKQNTR